MTGPAPAAPLAPSGDAPALILASASRSRRRLLEQAGVVAEVVPVALDEAAVKHSLRAEGADASQVAQALAELKARRVAQQRPGALVLGADQMMDCEGRWFDKPADRATAAAHLAALSGRSHRLLSAASVVRDDQVIWQHVATARLAMRRLSPGFIERYLDAAGEAVLGSVGAYQLEGLGAQLFERIDGDFFTVLGLPLLPLLAFLRPHGVVPT